MAYDVESKEEYAVVIVTTLSADRANTPIVQPVDFRRENVTQGYTNLVTFLRKAWFCKKDVEIYVQFLSLVLGVNDIHVPIY